MNDAERPSNDTPSVHPADRLTAERSRFLSRVTGVMLVISGVHLLVMILSGGIRHALDLTGYVVFGAFMVATLQLLKAGKLHAAGWILCGSLYLALITVGVTWGAIQPGMATSFIVLMLVAGFSMGSRAGAVSAVTGVVLFFLFAADESASEGEP